MKVETSPLNITEAEWEIMRVVWAQEETTSKDVTNILNKKTEWKTTTVKTLLHRLVEKKMLGTRKVSNKFIYYPLVEERQSIQAVTDDLLSKICSKKVGEVLESIIENSLLSHDDVVHLTKVLQNKAKTAVTEVPCNCVAGQCQCHLVNYQKEGK